MATHLRTVPEQWVVMDIEMLPDVLPCVDFLARQSFTIEAFEAGCRRYGWEPTRERFEPYGSGFDCWAPGPTPFVACFDVGDECAVLGILAVGDVEADPIYRVNSKSDLGAAFGDALMRVAPILGEPVLNDQYTARFGSDKYPYAFWTYPGSFLLLMEYPETDFSNDPSLDFRIVPRKGKVLPTLPLESNLIL